MANSYEYQVIKDTTEHVVIKLTASFDGSGQEANAVRIQANTLYGAMDSSRGNLLVSTANTGPLPYYGLALNRIWYDCPNSSTIKLTWNASTPKTLMIISGGGEYDGMDNWTTIPNNAKDTAGCNGDIGITTTGMQSGNGYTIVAEFRKENEYYQRGQFNDPAAFNYAPYNIRP